MMFAHCFAPPIALVLWTAWSVTASSETDEVPHAAEVVVLKGARVIDGSGSPPIPLANIIIADGRIEAIGSAEQVKPPPGAKAIDLRGKTILPGLISDHSHVGVVNGSKAAPIYATRENILRQLRQYAAYGVTTVNSLGLNGPAFYPVRDEVHAGTVPGADLFGADRGLGVPAGAPPLGWLPASSNQLDRPATPAEARAAVRAAAARKTDFIKLWLDDFQGTLKVKMQPEIYQAIIEEAHLHKLRVAAHVYSLADAKALVAAGIDIIAHGVRDRPVDDEFIESMKKAGTWYVPTLGLDESFYLFAERPAFTLEPFCLQALQSELKAQFADTKWRVVVANDLKNEQYRNALAINQRNLKRLHEAKVKIGFGTDSGATPLRVPGFAEHRELQLITDAGISPAEAIVMATRNAAQLLGLSDRGRLAPGMRADFIVLESNPMESIANTTKIVEVWQRGKKVSGPVTEFKP